MKLPDTKKLAAKLVNKYLREALHPDMENYELERAKELAKKEIYDYQWEVGCEISKLSAPQPPIKKEE